MRGGIRMIERKFVQVEHQKKKIVQKRRSAADQRILIIYYKFQFYRVLYFHTA